MKTIKVIMLSFACFLAVHPVNAQTKTEKIDVSGNCGMCKKTIEKAAVNGGAREANWDVATKILQVKYNSKRTNAIKIQEAVAETGYDTKAIRGKDAAYAQLHACCKYDRTKTYDTKK